MPACLHQLSGCRATAFTFAPRKPEIDSRGKDLETEHSNAKYGVNNEKIVVLQLHQPAISESEASGERPCRACPCHARAPCLVPAQHTILLAEQSSLRMRHSCPR